VSRAVVVFCIAIWALPFCLVAQTDAPSASPPAKKEKKEKSPKPSPEKSTSLLGPLNTQSTEPITTEIYADDAFFDSNKNQGIFSGHVKVADPRFTLQAEKLTVYSTKGQNQGLEKAVAQGNVAMVRDRPDPNGGAPTRAVGRADEATYVATTGDVELRGTPRVQEGVNTHIATSPETVMVVNQNGQLTTRGPSRTEIRQEPKTDDHQDAKQGDEKKEKKGEKKNEAKPAASPHTSVTP
jgi:lipopolysaccharide transport protein LptA